MSSDTAFGFADEMRVGLRGMVGRVWGRRGVKVHQRVQMVYKWTYLFLVVDVRRGRLLWSWIDSMRSAAIAAAVDGLKHHSDIEALVWDGARGHRGEMVRSVGLATIIQPPYSPELNPAERVFEEVRRWVEGRTYGSIEEKMEAVDAYCQGRRDIRPCGGVKVYHRGVGVQHNVTLRQASVGAVNWSECGGVYASAGSQAARTASACLLCLRR